MASTSSNTQELDFGELQLAHKGNPEKHHDGRCNIQAAPKFEGVFLRVALLVQLMAQSIDTCMQEQRPVVRARFTSAMTGGIYSP